MLYLVGLGLYDERDLSLRGLEVLKKADVVYVERYTNFFSGDFSRLESMINKKVTTLERSDVEEHPDDTLLRNTDKNVVLLVSGDPMVATTHIDLVLRAHKKAIPVQVVHSSSVYSAVGETGLQIYKFGKTTTMAFPEKSYFPKTPYEVVKQNQASGLHTLVLLDVKADAEKYMTVNDAVKLLLNIEGAKKEGVFTEKTMCVGVARFGGDTVIKYGNAKQLLTEEFGKPPHTIIIPGKLHFMEEEALKRFSV